MRARSGISPGRREPAVAARRDAGAIHPYALTPEFFIPSGDGQAGERAYQQPRRQVELRMGRAPNPRRIME